MANYVTVAKVGQVSEGKGEAFVVADRRIAVFFVDGQYYALDDPCPHMGAPLSFGDVRNGYVICDRHLWEFRLTDGVCPDIPALQARTYPVRIEGDEIQIDLPEEG